MIRKYMSMLGIIILLASGVACSNPDTPAGHEGYVTKGAIIGSVKFYDTQVGPTSTGLGWLLSAENIDVRWQTQTEEFEVMSADNLLLTFTAHAVIRPQPGEVQEVVETYGGVDWYQRSLQEPIRNSVYDAVSGYTALEAKEFRSEIATAAREVIDVYFVGKPFELQSLVVGTIQLPNVVARAQETKISKETELEQKQFEIAIAEQDALIMITEAEGISTAQEIINGTLTPLYIQHEAIQAQRAMAGSPNHTTVYIPVGPNGVPLVTTRPAGGGGGR